MRIPTILLASLLALPAGVRAQSAGTVELTAFGNYTWFDHVLNLHNEFGVGGTLGLFFVPHLALEVEGLWTPTTLKALNRDVNSYPPRARLTLNIPVGGYASAFQIGAGYVRTVYRNSYSYEDNGITSLAGFRFGLSRIFALRVNATLDYMPSPQANRVDHYMNWGVQAGVGVLFGNRYDKDHDKIADNKDKCPTTPKGAQVDANGCAATERDTDHDGLADAVDKCPATPAGQSVDPQGCSAEQRDTDHDGLSDAVDKCPATPAGEAVDGSGCSASQRDSDGDHIADAVDKCPNTPAGETVNADGCALSQVDSDHDGVPDNLDKCPNTTERGPAVDEHGCSAEQRDSDNDGIPDGADRCPNTPAGTAVDANGCPKDSDGDGVADAVDKCPGTPSGREVDENGCTRLFRGGARTLVLLGANFETGKAELTPDSRDALKDVAQALASHPDVKVQIAGYTDATGSKETNVRLSQERANAVMKYLVDNGVAKGQLTAKGYGPAQPVASNGTADGRAKNRRVELHRVQQ